MNLENLRSLKLNSLNTLNSLNPLITTIGATSNFLLEGVRCGLDMKNPRMGSTKAYIPFGDLIEAPQMRHYHKKFKKLLDTLVVLTSTSINADLVTCVDEQRHLHCSTCVNSCRLE